MRMKKFKMDYNRLYHGNKDQKHNHKKLFNEMKEEFKFYQKVNAKIDKNSTRQVIYNEYEELFNFVNKYVYENEK